MRETTIAAFIVATGIALGRWVVRVVTTVEYFLR